MTGNFNLGFLGGGPGISSSLSLGTNSLGLSVDLNVQPQPTAGQTFRTRPQPNFQPAIYGLAIRGSFGSLIGGFTFPLSPTALRKEHVAMTNVYDVHGSPSQGGVNRVMDTYGVSPVVFTIEGTTGWQFHSTDGYAQTGLQAISALEQFFFQYAELNATQIANNQPPYTMEFYDYFRGDYWQVEPWGPQGIRQTSQRPILVYYQYRLAGIQDLTHPAAAETDQVGNVLSGAQSPSDNTAGGIIDQGTGADPQSFGNTATPSGPTTTAPPVAPESLPSNDTMSPSEPGSVPPGLQASHSGVIQSSANLQENYGNVTPQAPIFYKQQPVY